MTLRKYNSLNICLISEQKKGKYLNKLQKILKSNKKDKLFLANNKISKNFISKNKINFLVSFHNSQIIGEDIINHLNQNCINFHCSLLPEAKGVYPILWTAYNQRKFGVTIQRINKYIDNGDILYQKEIKINNKETLKTAYNILEESIIKGFAILFKILRKEVIQFNSFKYKAKIKKKYQSSFFYMSQTKKLIELFPEGWDTKISEVKKIKL